MWIYAHFNCFILLCVLLKFLGMIDSRSLNSWPRDIGSAALPYSNATCTKDKARVFKDMPCIIGNPLYKKRADNSVVEKKIKHNFRYTPNFIEREWENKRQKQNKTRDLATVGDSPGFRGPTPRRSNQNAFTITSCEHWLIYLRAPCYVWEI